MSLTLLFDLDNTLLTNGMDTFLPAYFQALAAYVERHTDKDQFLKDVLAGTQQAIQNRDISRTLAEIFSCHFYPRQRLPRETLQPILDSFYQDIFPTLAHLTEQRPGAVQLMDTCFARGYRVVIATNPLFPLTAVEQRLAWAGIPVTQYPYDVVASLETFHFAKPNPAFFAEALARAGWPDHPVVVIGDDPVNDIAPAKKLGLSTFHIVDGPAQAQNAHHGQGRLEEFLPWLDSTDSDQHYPDIQNPEGFWSALAATPSALQAPLNSLPATFLDQEAVTGEWTLTQIFCHLRDVEREVHQSRLRAVIQTENPFLKAEDTDAWAETRNYRLQDGRQAYTDFLEARRQTLNDIDHLQPGDWHRPARHAIFGRTNLQELIRFVTEHDQLHLRQIRSVLETLPIP